MNTSNMIEELYAKLHDAGFIVELNEDSFVVSLHNRPVRISEVKIVTDYDERFSYTRNGNSVVVR
jgi:hypothetical protein